MRTIIKWATDEEQFAEVELTEGAGYGLREGDAVRFPGVLDNAPLRVTYKSFQFGEAAFKFQPDLTLYVYRTSRGFR